MADETPGCPFCAPSRIIQRNIDFLEKNAFNQGSFARLPRPAASIPEIPGL
jgi:hypothetical protein